MSLTTLARVKRRPYALGMAYRGQTGTSMQTFRVKRDAKMPTYHPSIEADHTPPGWVPANQRNDYIDPMSKDALRRR